MIYDFTLEPDEVGIVTAARSTLETLGRAGTKGLEGPDDRTALGHRAWEAFVEQGWHLLGVPEAAGGLGVSTSTAALLLEESGRHLVPGPLASTLAMASPLLAAATGEAVAADLLAGIVDGRPVSVAWAHDRTPPLVDDAGIHAPHVLAADMDVDRVLLVIGVDANGGAMVSAVESVGNGRIAPVRGYDELHVTSRVDLAGASTRAFPLDRASYESAWCTALTLLAAELVGIAARSVELAVQHAVVRTQFGRPIGAFQGIKHAIADDHVLVERARSLVYAAACAVDVADEPLGLGSLTLARMAKAAASEAAVAAASTCVQVLGAMGTTSEHEAIWFYRRARQAAMMLGDDRHHFRATGRVVANGMGRAS